MRKKLIVVVLATAWFICSTTGWANAGLIITNGLTFSVASYSDQTVGTHYHSNTGGVFGNPPGLAEVGNYGYEEVRGLSEYDLAGLDPAVSAFITFDVYGVGLFPGYNNFPFNGTVDIIAYDGNNLEDISDYQAASVGTVGSFSTVGMAVGDVFNFDILSIYNTAIANSWDSLGVRLQTEDTSYGGGAWVFHDFTLTTNPVPEPASMMLFGTGLFGLVGLRKKRK